MKKIINIFIRIFILCFILHTILFMINLSLKYKNESSESNFIDEYDNVKILIQNGQKLSTTEGNLTNDLTWLYNGEVLKEKKKKRILIIGDSFVWGYQNNNANTIYWKYLQRLFEENGYNDVEIVAAGIPGIGTYEELEYILENEEYLNKVKPDLVIMAFLNNDWESLNKEDELYLNKFNFDKFVMEHYNSGIYKILKKWYPYLYDWFINYKITNMTDDPNYNEKYGSKYGYNYGDLYELKNVIDLDKYIEKYENDAVKRLANLNYPFIVFHELFPLKGDFDDYFEQEAINMFHKYGIEVIDSVQNYNNLFNTYEIKDLYNNEIDFLHPSEFLNKFYAREIYDYLVTNYNDVVGTKSEIKKFDIEINDYYPYLELNLKKLGNYKYSFNWPIDENMLYYWTNTYTVRLNLKYPMKLSELKLNGEFENARIWVNFEDGQNEYIELKNIDNIFQIESEEKVASINIHVDANDDASIELEIKK